MPGYFEKEINELQLSDSEKELLNRVGSLMGQGTAQQISTQAKIISEINSANKIGAATDILGERILDSTSQLIETVKKQVGIVVKSNEKLAASNEKYVRGMLWLTVALVFVGIIQIVIKIIEIWKIF